MRVRTPTTSQSSCPLCLDLLRAQPARGCAVCQARVHTACAEEFGMCHAQGSMPRTGHPAREQQAEPRTLEVLYLVVGTATVATFLRLELGLHRDSVLVMSAAFIAPWLVVLFLDRLWGR